MSNKDCNPQNRENIRGFHSMRKYERISLNVNRQRTIKFYKKDGRKKDRKLKRMNEEDTKNGKECRKGKRRLGGEMSKFRGNLT